MLHMILINFKFIETATNKLTSSSAVTVVATFPHLHSCPANVSVLCPAIFAINVHKKKTSRLSALDRTG